MSHDEGVDRKIGVAIVPHPSASGNHPSLHSISSQFHASLANLPMAMTGSTIIDYIGPLPLESERKIRVALTLLLLTLVFP
ncbi:hypothetical protein F4X33_07325 [Candidatus Poribacteria bacterium]|nr:hypothetical protein [Candidatus Poribacteria bacterium]